MYDYSLALGSIIILHPCIVAAVGSANGNYLHFTPGDNLWFLGWVPMSAGAMVGTCIGLFMLGLIDRWISVCAAVTGGYWDKRSQILQSNNSSITTSKSDVKSPTSSPIDLAGTSYLQSSPPFIPSHDFPRGIIHATRSALKFVLMLAIMTFNVGFIFSILFGLGVGEMLFGRFATERVSW